MKDPKDLHRLTGETDMKSTPIDVDIARTVSQLHYMETETGEIINKSIKQANFLDFFTNRKHCLVGMSVVPA